MKRKDLLSMLNIMMALLLVVVCAGPSEPKEYVHPEAYFKITMPAGWRKTAGDSESFEFRSGDTKLIEVGSFALEISAEELQTLFKEDYMGFLKESAINGIEGYCQEARIDAYNIVEQLQTTWAGTPAYRLKAKGYSKELEASVVVDLITMVYKAKPRVYTFASQIAESEYTKTKSELEAAIASFQLTN